MKALAFMKAPEFRESAGFHESAGHLRPWKAPTLRCIILKAPALRCIILKAHLLVTQTAGAHFKKGRIIFEKGPNLKKAQI